MSIRSKILVVALVFIVIIEIMGEIIQLGNMEMSAYSIPIIGLVAIRIIDPVILIAYSVVTIVVLAIFMKCLQVVHKLDEHSSFFMLTSALSAGAIINAIIFGSLVFNGLAAIAVIIFIVSALIFIAATELAFGRLFLLPYLSFGLQTMFILGSGIGIGIICGMGVSVIVLGMEVVCAAVFLTFGLIDHWKNKI